MSSFKAQKTITRPEKRKYCYDQVCVYCILSCGLGEFRGFIGYKIPRRLSSYYLIFPWIEKTFPIDISFTQRAHLPFQGSPARPTVSILQVGNFAVPPQHSPACRWASGRAVQGYCIISLPRNRSKTSIKYLCCTTLQRR